MVQNNLTIKLVVLLLVFSGFIPAHAQTWDTVGSGNELFMTPPNWGLTSMAIDGNGIPYVAYHSSYGVEKSTVLKYSGNIWDTVGNAGFSQGLVDYISIAIDPTGTPYVVYQDQTNNYNATVMKYLSGSWVTVGNAGFSVDSINYNPTVDYTAIAIDGNGTPYVAYANGTDSNKATVMKYNGSSWVTVGNVGFSQGAAYFISLAIDSSGTPYVVYQDGGNGDKATVMKYNGSNWVNVGSAGLSADTAKFTTIAIDKCGRPYIVYGDAANSYKATVMKYNGGGWANVGIAGFSTGETQYTKLAIDENDTPYIVYEDIDNGRAIVMEYNGSSWIDVGAPVASGGADYSSIAINSNGIPYVICYSEIVGLNPVYYTAVVMDYEATTGITNVRIPGDNLFLFPNPNEGAFTIQGSLTPNDKEVSIKVMDMLGREVYRKTIKTQDGIIDAQVHLDNIMANSTFIVKVSSGLVNKTFDVVIER